MTGATAADSDVQAVFEFADLTLDTRRRAVFRGAVPIVLPKLSYELLLALVDAAPNVLTHDDVAARVWRRRLVTPETVTQRVLLLRRALGDTADDPRYLRVVRAQGFQLVPPARARRPSETRRLPPSRISAQLHDAPDFADDIDLSLPAQPSIVVLPFETDADPAHLHFARGLTHDVITRIARTRSFFVIARGSAFSFAPGSHHVREVSRKLGVRYVAQGNIQFHGSKMRINAALADAVEGREIWAEDFGGRLEDVFELQEKIAELIVAEISSEIELAERQRALLETPASLDAWSAYHRGCWHMYRFTPSDLEHAERFFVLAAKLDPNSSRTFSGLSFVHWQRAFLEISPDRAGEVQRAFDLAEQSVELNPSDPLGHWALGRAHLLRGEVGQSLSGLSTATALNPCFAVGQYTLGFALMQAGDTTRSIELSDKARRLSPYDPLRFAMIGLRGFSLAMNGQYEQAAKILALSVRQPGAHYQMIAMAAVCDALARNDDAARNDFGRLREAKPGYGASDFLRAYPFQRPAHTKLICAAFRRLERLR